MSCERNVLAQDILRSQPHLFQIYRRVPLFQVLTFTPTRNKIYRLRIACRRHSTLWSAPVGFSPILPWRYQTAWDTGLSQSPLRPTSCEASCQRHLSFFSNAFWGYQVILSFAKATRAIFIVWYLTCWWNTENELVRHTVFLGIYFMGNQRVTWEAHTIS